MNLQDLIGNIKEQPGEIQFTDIIAFIDNNYGFTPTAFKNGDLSNEAGQNSGSCKIFSFAKMHNLDKEQTLACFGAYYREDVLKNPDGTDHQNIRNFIRYGWEGVFFGSNALQAKS
jgi:hypothetical protein